MFISSTFVYSADNIFGIAGVKIFAGVRLLFYAIGSRSVLMAKQRSLWFKGGTGGLVYFAGSWSFCSSPSLFLGTEVSFLGFLKRSG